MNLIGWASCQSGWSCTSHRSALRQTSNSNSEYPDTGRHHSLFFKRRESDLLVQVFPGTGVSWYMCFLVQVCPGTGLCIPAGLQV